MKPIVFLCVFLTIFSFISCSAKIDGSLASDGTALVNCNVSVGSRMSALIRRITDASGQSNAPILDSQIINSSLMKSPGVSSVSFKNINPSTIEGSIRISKITDFLSPVGSGGFVKFEQDNSGGHLEIAINEKNGPLILKMLHPDISDYLEAIMAPIVSGEKMTKSNYLNEVTMMYNSAISDEIASSMIQVSIDFPGQITSVSGGTFSGKKASFNIPLVDLLVLEKPVVLDVRWK